MLKDAFVLQSGMVMAFDEHGQQIPGLQGSVEAVAVPVLLACGPDTVIRGAIWSEVQAKIIDITGMPERRSVPR